MDADQEHPFFKKAVLVGWHGGRVLKPTQLPYASCRR